jgi:hypothetical protein
MGVDIRGLSILNKAIAAYGFVPKYIVTKPKSEGIAKVVEQALKTLSEIFPSTWNSTSRLLKGLGSSLVVLLTFNVVNLTNEGYRFCIKICAAALLLLLGYEAYRKWKYPNDRLLPVTQQSDYWHNLGAITFGAALRRKISYVTSADNFGKNAVRNCTLFGAIAEFFSVMYLLGLNSSNGFKSFGLSLFCTTLGALAGLVYTVSYIEPATLWDQWKMKAVANGDWSKFQRFVDRNLKSFVCPYTQELILIPANIGEEETTYEKATIEAKSQDVRFDPSYYHKVVHEIDRLLRIPDQVLPEVQEGLLKYRETLKKEETILGCKVVSEITKPFLLKQIGIDDFELANNLYHDYYRILDE